jgi:hypothetical protein
MPADQRTVNEVGGVVVGGVGVMGGSVVGGVVIGVVVVGSGGSVVDDDVVDPGSGAVVVDASIWRLRDFAPGEECPPIVHPVFVLIAVASLGIAAHAPIAYTSTMIATVAAF